MTEVRCFVAVDLPEGMRDEIGRIQSSIATEELRLVRPELVHITLKFLGEVPAERVERIVEALRAIRAAPFPSRVRGMGAFPGRSIRVVWLGLEGDFAPLYGKIESALEPLGFEREERGFSPHVTLGRVSRPNSRMNQILAPKIAALSASDLGSFTVDHFNLKKSTLTRGGPLYEDLAEFHLRDQG